LGEAPTARSRWMIRSSPASMRAFASKAPQPRSKIWDRAMGFRWAGKPSPAPRRSKTEIASVSARKSSCSWSYHSAPSDPRARPRARPGSCVIVPHARAPTRPSSSRAPRGSKERLEEDTLTGNTQRDWGLELAAEAVARAHAAGVMDDLERVLSHARLGLEQRLAEGRTVERHLVDGIGIAAGEVAVFRGEAGWGRWALSIFASLGMAPPVGLSELLARLPDSELGLLAPAAQRALESAGARQSADDTAGQAALSRLLGGLKP